MWCNMVHEGLHPLMLNLTYLVFVPTGIASEQMNEVAAQHAGTLVVVATGPLTNLALALQQNQHLVSEGQHLPSFSL